MDTNEIEIEWSNVGEILGMGGPWVGNLIVNGKQISDSVIEGNYLIDERKRRLYFVKYHNVSRWASRNFFLIHFYDLNTNQVESLPHKYEMVYLESIVDDGLIVFNAFHNKDASTRDYAPLA